ncbi:MAG TPA: SurA N-terminal domain-containing protein, partial [Cryomorphaceae bacterium]|nr:SurA N-terminal domain-containing protein [Cryomorphaceae bacterium]
MAAIGKIRERSTLLLIVIGVAMVAFILGDFVAGQGNSPASQYVGEVYGEEINMLDYEQRVENEVQAMNSVGNPISTTDPQVRNQVWDDMIQEMIMYKELNELGVRMSREEYDDIRFGENANPEFRSGDMFKNPETGTFDPMAVQNYFALMESDFPVYHQVEQRRLMNGRLYEKYNNMIKLGIAVNTLDAKDQYYRQEQKADFTYVVRTFASIADSTIEVSEKELKAYYDKHKHEDRFEQDPEVDLEYVVFTVEASEEDKEYTREELSNLKEEFANASNDSSFAVRHSDSRRAMLKTLEAGGDDELQAMIDSAQIGDVIGPYELDGIMAIAKVVETDVKELATARHILLSKDNTPDIDVLNSRADSIVRVI